MEAFLVAAEAEKAENGEARSLHQLVVLGDQLILKNRQTRKEPEFWKVRATLAFAVMRKSGICSSWKVWPLAMVEPDHAHRRLVEAGDAV